jgi:hypothetical protein
MVPYTVLRPASDPEPESSARAIAQRYGHVVVDVGKVERNVRWTRVELWVEPRVVVHAVPFDGPDPLGLR